MSSVDFELELDMFKRLRPADAALALLIALPTLALPAPGNAATDLPAPPTATQLADSHADRLAELGHDQQRPAIS